MIKHILCPVDRSPRSLQAFGYALALARWQDARLNLLEVIEAAAPPRGSRVPENDGVPHDTRAALERDLGRVLAARRASDVRVKILTRTGNVVQEILAQAKASRADLVVIGSHGRGGVQRLVLGSVAEKVLGCRASKEHRVGRARRTGSSVTRSGPTGPGAQAVVTVGKPSAAILKLARARSADLIVMGVSGRGATDVALLGSTTHQVIREGTWPVLTVRTATR